MIELFLNEINKLEFDSEPAYLIIINKLTDTLELLGHSGKDNFYAFGHSKNSSNLVHVIIIFLNVMFYF